MACMLLVGKTGHASGGMSHFQHGILGQACLCSIMSACMLKAFRDSVGLQWSHEGIAQSCPELPAAGHHLSYFRFNTFLLEPYGHEANSMQAGKAGPSCSPMASHTSCDNEMMITVTKSHHLDHGSASSTCFVTYDQPMHHSYDGLEKVLPLVALNRWYGLYYSNH